ncbi:MAG: hypothetical protein ACYC9Z_09505 [Casimicrobiaceae bacterium]
MTASFFCCLVALVLAAAMFVEPVMLKLAAFVTRHRAIAAAAGVLLALVALSAPAVLLFVY